MAAMRRSLPTSAARRGPQPFPIHLQRPAAPSSLPPLPCLHWPVPCVPCPFKGFPGPHKGRFFAASPPRPSRTADSLLLLIFPPLPVLVNLPTCREPKGLESSQGSHRAGQRGLDAPPLRPAFPADTAINVSVFRQDDEAHHFVLGSPFFCSSIFYYHLYFIFFFASCPPSVPTHPTFHSIPIDPARALIRSLPARFAIARSLPPSPPSNRWLKRDVLQSIGASTFGDKDSPA